MCFWNWNSVGCGRLWTVAAAQFTWTDSSRAVNVIVLTKTSYNKHLALYICIMTWICLHAKNNCLQHSNCSLGTTIHPHHHPSPKKLVPYSIPSHSRSSSCVPPVTVCRETVNVNCRNVTLWTASDFVGQCAAVNQYEFTKEIYIASSVTATTTAITAWKLPVTAAIPHFCFYTVSQKNVHLFIFQITLSKINQL